MRPEGIEGLTDSESHSMASWLVLSVHELERMVELVQSNQVVVYGVYYLQLGALVVVVGLIAVCLTTHRSLRGHLVLFGDVLNIGVELLSIR